MTGLIAPRLLPNGSVEWSTERPEIATLLRDGDPDTGWLGDDRLTLVLNMTFKDEDPQKRNLPRWEVWRDHEGAEPSLVVWCVAQRIDGHQLCLQLALHDSRTHDIAAEILAKRDKRREAIATEHRDQNEANADKLAWALGRDLDAPAQSGRIFTTS